MKRLAFLALCWIAAGCNRGDGTGSPSIPGPQGAPPVWGDVVPDDPYDEANDPPVVSECVPDPEPEAVPTPIDDDGGADTGEPGFTITVTPESFNIPPGGSIDLAVTVTRVGDFEEPIDVTVDGLPAGVTASPLSLAPGECECEHIVTLVSDEGLSTPRANAARVRGNAPAGTRSVPIGMTVRGIAGTKDPSFANRLNNTLYSVRDLVEQPDGKLIVTGWDGADTLAVCRMEADGSPDLEFGSSGGCARPDLGFDATGTRLLRLPDGRILVAAGGWSSIVVAALTPSGALDMAFGDGGRARIDAIDYAGISDMILVGGKVVVGWTNNSASEESWVTRLNANGSLDESFGTYGRIVVAQRTHAFERLGKCGFVAAAGDVLRAYTWSGDTDLAFGGGDVPIPQGAWSIHAATDGELFVGGSGMAVTRISVAGYSGAAYARMASGSTTGLAVLPGGSIVATGSVTMSDSPALAIGRRLPNGDPDPDFGTNGVSSGYEVGSAGGVTVLRDGRYLLFGTRLSSEGLIYRVWD